MLEETRTQTKYTEIEDEMASGPKKIVLARIVSHAETSAEKRKRKDRDYFSNC
jgi:hypothetical protein